MPKKKYEPLHKGDIYRIPQPMSFEEGEIVEEINALVLEDSLENHSVVYLLLPNLKTIYYPKKPLPKKEEDESK